MEVKVIGVTGGIGSGKSTACRWLAQRTGAVHIDADAMAHSLYSEPNSPIVQEISNMFGNSTIMVESGHGDGGDVVHVNRPALARIIFSNETARQQLQELVWPRVKERIQQQIQQLSKAAVQNRRMKEQQQDQEIRNQNGFLVVIIVEAALLLEAGWDELLCDATWIVTANRSVALSRLVHGERQLSKQDAEQRMAAQAKPDGYWQQWVQQQQQHTSAGDKSNSNKKNKQKNLRLVDNSKSLPDLQEALQQAWNETLDMWLSFSSSTATTTT